MNASNRPGANPSNGAGLPDGNTLASGRRRRVPLIQQTEATECGLACLAMVAGHYGQHTSLAQLRQRFPASLKGTTLTQLMDVADAMAMTARPLRLELDELSRLRLPCVLHWGLDHFVVLVQVDRQSMVLHDPALGERRVSLAVASQHFSGVALELTPKPTFRRQQQPPAVSLRQLAGSIQGLRRSLAALFGLALLLELCGLAVPQFLQITIDQVLADSDNNLLTILGLSFAALLLLQTGLGALRTWTVVVLGAQFSLQWMGGVFGHLMRLPQAYFLKRHLGDVVSRFGAIDTIQHTLTSQFVGALLDGVMALATLSVMAVYSLPLAALTVVAMVVYVLLRLAYYRILRESNLSQILASARQQSQFMEAVRGVQTIRLHNLETTHTARYMNAATQTINTGVAVQKLNLAFGALNGFVTGSQRIAVLWIGAWLGLQGHFSAGMLIAFVAYADQFTGRAASLVDYAIQWRLLRLQAERLADIVLTPAEPHRDGVYVGPAPEPSIQFEHVSFRYGDNEPWILRDCTFEVAAGSSIAIAGPSGSGKSTLVRLLLGLLDPQEGTIRIGGIALEHLGKRRLRELVGSVMQDDTLFAGSVADNISAFDEGATLARVEEAARTAQLHDDLCRMPMAYHTRVGDMGAALSGGQAQRVLLARALYRQSQILVLDEATSQVDVACERAIAQQLRHAAITRLLVAHRPETIASADRVLWLEQGTVRIVAPSAAHVAKAAGHAQQV
ncbi:peptidase domain-containing ABC transporter (plasmid) [Ralstonia solanacearum]|nr:peptidase domain-containing ABC transporter [Ralstonia solanacearum]